MNGLMVICFILLVGCGGASSETDATSSAPWRGGLFDVWIPDGKPRAAIILHQGHGQFDAPTHPQTGEWYNLAVVAKRFADAGYMVIGFEMPPMPHNAGPIERFYQPVMDYIETVPVDLPLYMVGFSGGGFTTSIVTALSERIVKGYSVQGDAPLALRSFPLDCDNLTGDEGWEQCNPPHDYETLYSMAGSRLLHIYAYDDGGGRGSLSYAHFSTVPNYPHVVDYTATNHSFTNWSFQYILSDINATL